MSFFLFKVHLTSDGSLNFFFLLINTSIITLFQEHRTELYIFVWHMDSRGWIF